MTKIENFQKSIIVPIWHLDKMCHLTLKIHHKTIENSKFFAILSYNILEDFVNLFEKGLYEYTRKFPLCLYILGVLTPTPCWNNSWEVMKL